MSDSKKLRPASKEMLEKMFEAKRHIILDTSTGIYYMGIKEAAFTLNLNHKTLTSRLGGKSRNKTSFLYV
jgi:hypothetical protein